MALPPPPKRSNEAGADASDAVAQARTKARRRLVGALVLLGAGIVAFPLVFETQPRPVAVDIPIEIPRKDGAPPLAMPAPRPVGPSASLSVPVDDAMAAPKAVTASAPVAKADANEKAADKAAEKATEKAAEKAPEKPAEKPAARAAASAAVPAKADGARAQALLESRVASKPAEGAGRFVVQVGAFTDPAAVREARAKVEKIGLTSYTQAVETATGTRTRVRVGPFANREDADRALGKARSAGLDGVVLSL